MKIPNPAASEAVAPATDPTRATALDLPGGRQGVLLFHGVSSTPLELQYLARGLHRAGFTVRVAVIEGYTHGLPARASHDHATWINAALAEFDRMRGQCDALAVGGLCIGSLLALHIAARRGAAVSHVLSLSTSLYYDGWAVPHSRWLLPLARVLPGAGRIAVREREPFGLKDGRLRAWIAHQMKTTGGSAAGAAVLRVGDLLKAQNLRKIVRRELKAITAPILLIHAKEDDAASIRSARDVAHHVNSQNVRFVILRDSYHMISIDQEKARVLDEMKDFLHSATGCDTARDRETRLDAQALFSAINRNPEHAAA